MGVNWAERIEQVGGSVAAAMFLSVGSALTWLVRRVLTNQQQNALLEQEIKHRDTQRKEDREALSDVRDSVKRIEDVLMKGRD